MVLVQAVAVYLQNNGLFPFPPPQSWGLNLGACTWQASMLPLSYNLSPLLKQSLTDWSRLSLNFHRSPSRSALPASARPVLSVQLMVTFLEHLKVFRTVLTALNEFAPPVRPEP